MKRNAKETTFAVTGQVPAALAVDQKRIARVAREMGVSPSEFAAEWLLHGLDHCDSESDADYDPDVLEATRNQIKEARQGVSDRRLNVELPADVFVQLESAAAATGSGVNDLVVECVRAYFDSKREDT